MQDAITKAAALVEADPGFQLLVQQLQGGVLQALSVALHERITVTGGAVEQGNFDTYRLLRLPEVPRRVEVYFAETDAIVGLAQSCSGTTTACAPNSWGSGLRRHFILNSVDGAGGSEEVAGHGFRGTDQG